LHFTPIRSIDRVVCARIGNMAKALSRSACSSFPAAEAGYGLDFRIFLCYLASPIARPCRADVTLSPCASETRANNQTKGTGFNVQVLVRDNNVDQALRALKKKMQREGIFREMKMRDYYEKPSQKRAREKAEAVRRVRKLARKRMQREGLLPSARPAR
jgi:small subunit ribosomal protein S21